MKEEIKKEIQSFLQKQMMEKISVLVSLFVVSRSEDKEVQKTLETTEFMEALFSGKNWPKKDMEFKEKYADKIQEIYDYSNAIQSLSTANQTHE